MTDWDALARDSLRGLERYHPGPSRDQLKQLHGLDDMEPLNWNEDLFGPPQAALDAAAEELQNASRYPESAFANFRDAVAAWRGVPAACVTPAHGAQALIGSVAAAFIENGTAVVVPRLTYGLYAQVSAAAGGAVTRVDAKGLAIDLEAVVAAARATGARLVWLCDPNNPTGVLVSREGWSWFLDELPSDCVVVADEAYMDFADPELRADREQDVAEGRPVIVIRSFSKIFGLAGLRLGYAIADPAVPACWTSCRSRSTSIGSRSPPARRPSWSQGSSPGAGRRWQRPAMPSVRPSRAAASRCIRPRPTSCWSSWASTTCGSATSWCGGDF